MILVVPSRGRPQRAEAMALSARQTASQELDIVVVVDADDPALGGYEATVSSARLQVLETRLGYSGSMNAAARLAWDDQDVLGAFGDDVMFRTAGWDDAVRRALKRPGLAYPNDLAWNERWATAVFMSAAIARALGWLAYPGCRHQYVDNVWWELGHDLGRLRYLGDVVVEHLHPAWGKADDDEGYRSVYSEPQATIDHDAFHAWKDGPDRQADVERARPALRRVR